MTSLPPIDDLYEEYELLEGEDRYRLLIDLGRKLEPMPDALKTDATMVRGCSASVWVYPTAVDGLFSALPRLAAEDCSVAACLGFVPSRSRFSKPAPDKPKQPDVPGAEAPGE